MIRSRLFAWQVGRRLGPTARVTSTRFDKVVFGRHVGWWFSVAASVPHDSSAGETLDRATAAGRRLLLDGIDPVRWLLRPEDAVMLVVTTPDPPPGLPRQIIRLPLWQPDLAAVARDFRQLGGWNAPTTDDGAGDPPDETNPDEERVEGWRWGIRIEWLRASRR